jgi:lanosterol synthase
VARLENPRADASLASLEAAVRFVLRCQNGDGGFGSFEARRVEIPARMDIPAEWMNPAEMLGYAMTEHSSIECTASCVLALAKFRDRHPFVLRREVDAAIGRGGLRIRSLQNPDGSWRGSFGVDFIYGTMFGIRGLLGAGAPPRDPAVRRAAGFLLSRQRADGGWGEKRSPRSKDLVEADSHVVQTAWALAGLLESFEMNWDAVERGVAFLTERQLDNGEWPKQEPVGVFFRSTLIDFALYRTYFPLRALALYESRRIERAGLVEGARVAVST